MTRSEDEVFEEWKGSNGEVKRALEEELRGLLTKHAYAVCWAKLGVHRPDIVNHALYHALERSNKFQGKSKFSTWFEAIVRNMCNTALEKMIREKREKSLEDLNEGEQGELGQEVEVDARLELEQLVERLEPEERELVTMKLHGLEDREIAERLGLTEEGVRSRWFRLRKKVQGDVKVA